MRVGQNLRPGGTSAGSYRKKPDKRARGREPERRARDTDRQQGERERESSLGLTEGEPECSESELPLGSESRESRSEHNPPPPLCARPQRRAHARYGERGRAGGREGARAVPLYLVLHSKAMGKTTCSGCILVTWEKNTNF